MLVDNDQMELIFEEVGTGTTSMSIIDGEEGALRPILYIFPGAWPRHVEYYGHSVFVVVSLDALMCVGSIRSDNAVGFRGKLGLLKVF